MLRETSSSQLCEFLLMEFVPLPSHKKVHELSLIWALFWDGGGIERGILKAYDLCQCKGSLRAFAFSQSNMEPEKGFTSVWWSL